MSLLCLSVAYQFSDTYTVIAYLGQELIGGEVDDTYDAS